MESPYRGGIIERQLSTKDFQACLEAVREKPFDRKRFRNALAHFRWWNGTGFKPFTYLAQTAAELMTGSALAWYRLYADHPDVAVLHCMLLIGCSVAAHLKRDDKARAFEVLMKEVSHKVLPKCRGVAGQLLQALPGLPWNVWGATIKFVKLQQFSPTFALYEVAFMELRNSTEKPIKIEIHEMCLQLTAHEFYLYLDKKTRKRVEILPVGRKASLHPINPNAVTSHSPRDDDDDSS